MEFMGWDDLNWLEDVHMGYEAGQPAIFDRNINGWVRIPKAMKLPDNQQDRDMLARELLVRFQTSPKHPLNDAEQGLSQILGSGAGQTLATALAQSGLKLEHEHVVGQRGIEDAVMPEARLASLVALVEPPTPCREVERLARTARTRARRSSRR